jgi:hypothetical protein
MAATLVSLEEYLHTSYEPDMEYVDGVLVGRNVGTQWHGLLQSLVASHLGQFRKTHQIQVFMTCRLCLSTTGRHRVPDIMVAERPYTKGQVVTDVPAIVIEINLPTTASTKWLISVLNTQSWEFRTLWSWIRIKKRQYVFADEAVRIVTSIVLVLPKSGGRLPFPVDDLFAELETDYEV